MEIIKLKENNIMIPEVNKILKIGITGKNGFIGTHLFNFLNLQKGVKIINF